MRKVFFVNSGSEANDLALRLVWAYTKKKDVVVVDHGYHGHTCSVVDISPYKFTEKKDWVHVVQVPRNKYTGKASLAEIRDVVKKRPVAGFFIESGMSVAGVVIPHDGYLEAAYEVIRAQGGLCIADEVQVGFGRFGDSFWGFQHANVVPDIVTCGKPMGNGMPLACVITTEEIANCLSKEYFNTFGGNPVCCAAGLAMMRVLKEEWLMTRAAEVGKYWKQQLSRFLVTPSYKPMDQSPYAPFLTDIRGRGLFMGLEFRVAGTSSNDETTARESGGDNTITRLSSQTEEKSEEKTENQTSKAKNFDAADEVPPYYKAASAETSMICSRFLAEHNILTSIDGPDDNVIVLKPPLCFSKADVDTFVGALRSILSSFEPVVNHTHTPT